MATTTTPGVTVELTDAPPALDPVAVDVPAFVGVFERGPLDSPVRVTSWPEVQAVFGDFIANGIGAYALKAWLDNGGRAAHVVRVAAPARATTGAAAQPADRWRSALVELDGFVPGAAVAIRTASQTWLHLVGAVDEVTSEVTWDRPLAAEVDLTVAGTTVHAGAAAADALLSADDGTEILAVRATSPGAWGNAISVTVDRQAPAATNSRAVAAPSAAATAVESVEGFAAPAGVRITQDDGAGGVLEIRRVVAGVDVRERVLRWDTPLTVVNAAQPLRVETETFALSVRRGGRLVEVFDDLSIVTGSAREVSAVVSSRSAFVAVERLPAAVTAPPAPAGPVASTAGRDGTAALRPIDLLGDELAGVRRGLAAVADVDEPAIVAIPDLVAEPVAGRVATPPGPPPDPCDPCPPAPAPPDPAHAQVREAGASFDGATIARAQQAMIDHCERRADRIALLDPPCGLGPLSVPALATWRTRFSTSYAAAYAPWVAVIDPLERRAALRRLPPSGHVAGVIARVDGEIGPWLAPANRSLAWTHALDTAIDDPGHGLLNGAGIDVLRALPGRGPVILGARTVASDPQWRFVSVRRLFLMLERTLRVGLAWTAFEPAGPALDRAMAMTIASLLEDLAERGAFAGPSPESSYTIHTGGGDRLGGEVIVDVGVWAASSIEHILLQVVRQDDRLEIRELPDRSV